MAILSKGQTFADGDDVTHTKLNNLVDAATFVSGSSGTTDDSSLEVNGSGRLQVKASGITTGKISASAVTTTKLASSTGASDGVTFAKIQYLSDMTVIGNVSGGLTTPTEVSILDEDDMSSDSDTSLATQQSIKAYVGSALASGAIDAGQSWQDLTGSRAVNTNYTNSTGGPIMVYARVGNAGYQNIKITSDGLEVAQATSTNSGGSTGCNAIIPNGAVYQVTVVSGGTTLHAWSELRP